MEDGEKQGPRPSKKPHSKRMWPWIGLITLLVIVAVLVAIPLLQANRGGIPSKYARQVSFPLYFPDHLPPGFTLKKDSFTVTPDALIYIFTSDKKQIVVTIQARPQSFDPQQFKPDKELTTYIGRAYLVDLEYRTTAAITNDTSLIFVNAPQGLPMDAMEQFVNSLRRTDS